MPLRSLFICMADTQHPRVVKVTTRDLQAQGQSGLAETARQCQSRCPCHTEHRAHAGRRPFLFRTDGSVRIHVRGRTGASGNESIVFRMKRIELADHASAFALRGDVIR